MNESDVSLLRVACAALDEAADYLGRRVGTYDEQPDEADALRRVEDASTAIKQRLAVQLRETWTFGPMSEVVTEMRRGSHR